MSRLLTSAEQVVIARLPDWARTKLAQLRIEFQLEIVDMMSNFQQVLVDELMAHTICDLAADIEGNFLATLIEERVYCRKWAVKEIRDRIGDDLDEVFDGMFNGGLQLSWAEIRGSGAAG